MEKEVSISKRAEKEESTLKFWNENNIFEKTLEKESPKGEFVFYDGPPFATGLPHYGHIVASAIKDIIPRYKTMQGFHVPRVWGWDCHGLPIENIVEKELGFKSKKDIKEFGIDKFNERCREQVLTYAHEWEKIIPRIGRWVDMKNAYKTMDKNYMESVWWVFKQLFDKNLIYEDYRIMHICPRCETTLSQQEVSEGYKNVKDISVTVKFKVKNPEKIGVSGDTYILAWTTTPWTLPGNVALAVGEEINYVKVESEGSVFILAKEKVDASMAGKEYKVIAEIKGIELIGLEYEPLFDYYYKDESLKNRENGWKVYGADFITTDAGTGIAHEAPAFGAEDWVLSKQFDLPFVQHVNMDGTFKAEVTDFMGLHVKPKEDPTSTDVEIIKYLAKKDLLFSKEKIEHSYPHCWRCDTPLLNYATSSWFVSVTQIKPDLLKYAEGINWSPEHVKEGRFGNWLSGARDWSVSRQRFWASAIPMWVCDSCHKQIVIGSASELEELSGSKVDDLHKHIIDNITWKCECGGTMNRIPDVLDTWFDSGSMPYAQVHYPFENKEKFERTFPAKFIGEGIDQTRAWFYYLHVIAGGIFNKNAFENVIVNGIVLAEDGQKMSKKLKNYPDPVEVINKYGADPLRLYISNSPVVAAEDLLFSEKGIDELVKKVFNPLENILSFYEMYKTDTNSTNEWKDSKSVLDKWIISRLNQLIKEGTENLDKYKIFESARVIRDFVNDFSTWYVRRSRDRFKSENDNDKQAALGTTRYVLCELMKYMAPFTPFFSEEIFSKVKESNDPESVHLTAWPLGGDVDLEILKNMEEVRKTVSFGLEKRNSLGIKVRQPLQSIKVKSDLLKGKEEYLELIKEELNVKEVTFDSEINSEIDLDANITPELEREGNVRDIIRAVQELRKVAGLTPNQKINLLVETDSEGEKFIKEVTTEISKPTNIEIIEFCKNEGLYIEFANINLRLSIK